MNACENRRTQQCGPSVDRILEKGLLVLPKLDSLEVSTTADFYDKLHKTSALFLLPLMLFDAINLNMALRGFVRRDSACSGMRRSRGSSWRCSRACF
jgi:hypothetical protein